MIFLHYVSCKETKYIYPELGKPLNLTCKIEQSDHVKACFLSNFKNGVNMVLSDEKMENERIVTIDSGLWTEYCGALIQSAKKSDSGLWQCTVGVWDIYKIEGMSNRTTNINVTVQSQKPYNFPGISNKTPSNISNVRIFHSSLTNKSRNNTNATLQDPRIENQNFLPNTRAIVNHSNIISFTTNDNHHSATFQSMSNIQNLSEIESRYINSNNILGQRSSDEPGLLFSNQNTKKHKLTDKSLQHINDPRIVDTTTHLVPHLADGDSFLQNINPVSNKAEDLTHINVIFFLFILICTTAII